MKNKKFVYCYDNIEKVCEAHGNFDGSYFLYFPDDPEFVFIETPAIYCGLNDSGEEVWEIDGKKYTVVPYITGDIDKPVIRLPKNLPGEILQID